MKRKEEAIIITDDIEAVEALSCDGIEQIGVVKQGRLPSIEELSKKDILIAYMDPFDEDIVDVIKKGAKEIMGRRVYIERKDSKSYGA